MREFITANIRLIVALITAVGVVLAVFLNQKTRK